MQRAILSAMVRILDFELGLKPFEAADVVYKGIRIIMLVSSSFNPSASKRGSEKDTK